MRSPFPPARAPDPAILDDHRRLIGGMTRRGLLRGPLSLGALTALTGCNLSSEPSVQSALLTMSSWNDLVQSWLFDPDKLAPTYRADQVLRPPRFNAYYPIDQVKPVAAAGWKLEISGRVEDTSPWDLARLASLPQSETIIRHICVEGWDYIGQWSGPTLANVLDRIGADRRARYVVFRTADDYPSSIDMATARHPQTLLATGYGGDRLDDPFGFPLRLRTATKLGFKNPKWITAMEVTDTYQPGYWEQRGFNWFSGL